MFDFNAQLKVGKEGEQKFLKKYKRKVEHVCEKEDIKGPDFRLKKCGSLVELKTDTYDMTKTENFFMEYMSDLDKEKFGGPWQALEKGADYFVYYFTKNDTYFWFDCQRLVDFLDGYLTAKNYGSAVYVRNRAWTTAGYKIPRDILEHLRLEV